MVVLSGPLSSGKSSIARLFRQEQQATVITAREILLQHGARTGSRSELQALGEALEESTEGRWLVESILSKPDMLKSALTVVDSVRTLRQAGALRQALSTTVIVHVTATLSVRRHRFERVQQDAPSALEDVADPFSHPIELHADDVSSVADFVIDTSGIVVRAAYSRVSAAVSEISER